MTRPRGVMRFASMLLLALVPLAAVAVSVRSDDRPLRFGISRASTRRLPPTIRQTAQETPAEVEPPPTVEPAPLEAPPPGPAAETPQLVEALPPASPIFNLCDLVALAEANHPALYRAAAGIAEAQGLAHQEGLYPNPRLDVFSPQLNGQESQYAAQLSQEIVVKGKLKLQRAAALRDVALAHLTCVRTRFEVLTDVRQKFYTVLAGQRRVSILTELVGLLQKSRDIAHTAHEAGFGTRTDVVLLDIELHNAEVSLQNAEALLAAARRQLAAAIGLPEMEICVVDGDLQAIMPDYECQAYALGILHHTEVLSAAERIEQSRIRLQRALVEPVPNPTLTGGAMYELTAPHKFGMFQISIPLPVWDRNQGNISAAYANIAKATAAYSVARNDLTKSLAGMIGRYRAAQQLVDRYEQKILPAAEEARQIIQLGFETKELDFLRVLQAQRAVVDSNLGYVKAQEDRWAAAAEIADVLQLECFP